MRAVIGGHLTVGGDLEFRRIRDDSASIVAPGPGASQPWTGAKGSRQGYPAAGALFGLDLGREQVDRGAAFVRGVIERAGEEGLARLVASAKTLPTPAEIEAPGLWLERINLPDED